MTLVNPIWLWALGGLTIPLAIHLLSRKEGKTIRIGSIRFLAETSTSKFSSIRLNEVALLALRSLLIALIILFLASLLLPTADSKASEKWVVVERGLESNEKIKTLLDSLQKNDYEIHSLSESFPLPENDTTSHPPDYYKLSEELSQKKNLHAIVLAGNSLSSFKGKRISLPENITWLSYPVFSAHDFQKDSIISKDTIRITLAYDKTFQYDKIIMLASLNALRSVAPAKIAVEETEVHNFKISDTHWVIWLSTDKLSYEGKSLRFREDEISDIIIQENKNQWILTKRLNEENSLEHHLPIELMKMLFNEQTNKEIHAQDKRVVSDELAWSGKNIIQSTPMHEAGTPTDKTLILLIALTFIAERVLAFYRKQ